MMPGRRAPWVGISENCVGSSLLFSSCSVKGYWKDRHKEGSNPGDDIVAIITKSWSHLHRSKFGLLGAWPWRDQHLRKRPRWLQGSNGSHFLHLSFADSVSMSSSVLGQGLKVLRWSWVRSLLVIPLLRLKLKVLVENRETISEDF